MRGSNYVPLTKNLERVSLDCGPFSGLAQVVAEIDDMFTDGFHQSLCITDYIEHALLECSAGVMMANSGRPGWRR